MNKSTMRELIGSELDCFTYGKTVGDYATVEYTNAWKLARFYGHYPSHDWAHWKASPNPNPILEVSGSTSIPEVIKILALKET